MMRAATTRHLGLDSLSCDEPRMGHGLGQGDAWDRVATAEAPTRVPADPDAAPATIVAQPGRGRRRGRGEDRRPVESLGVGVPGLYDPLSGTTHFLVNIPGPWPATRWPLR